MGLPPLEYIECFLDSPTFREIISLYEKELEDNDYQVQTLVKECKHMIRAAEEFSKVQRSFATVLGNFTFQIIGEKTEDEKMITNSLQNFSALLTSIEENRENMVATISIRLLQTLEKFRKEHIQKARDEKKQFDKATHHYYDALPKHLAMNTKKKDFSQPDADALVGKEHATYRQSAFDYASRLQDVHAQKQYELVEPILGFITDLSTFLHLSYDCVSSLKPELEGAQFKAQILRETHSETLEKADELKQQVIEEGEAGLVRHPDYLRQGTLFVQDSQKKVQFGTQWHRYFSQFRKKSIGGKQVRQIKFIPVGHQGNLPNQEFMEVRECVRKKTAESDRQFCFDLDLISLQGTHKYTVQATSSTDRKGWMEVMEGKEPVYTSLRPDAGDINDNGIAFVQKCIDTIESRGLEEEGLYRKPGVVAKVNKLVKDCLVKGKIDQINLSDELEWDTATIASAVKYYLNKHLGEPLFTFTMHQQFIEVAKISDREKRASAIRELYDQLPQMNKNLTAIIVWHLSRVAAMSDRNLMKASNIGVCFGPTLMRPERESVASIVDIKYQNIIVETMVENVEEVFSDGGSLSMGPPPIVPFRERAIDSGGQVISKPAPPPNSVTTGTQNASSKAGDSPSPEPYEVPMTKKNEDIQHSRKPPRSTTGPPPPIPKHKPRIMVDERRRAFTATAPASVALPKHRQQAGKRLSNPITTTKPDQSPSSQASAQASKKQVTARALYDCKAEDDIELSFKKGDMLYNVTESDEPDWLQATLKNGKSGLVPAPYIEKL